MKGRLMRALKGQLQSDGSLGKIQGYTFVQPHVVADRLKKDGTKMCLTVGLSFRNPRTHNKVMDLESSQEWLEKYGRMYCLEGYYNGEDNLLYVTALSGNDMF